MGSKGRYSIHKLSRVSGFLNKIVVRDTGKRKAPNERELSEEKFNGSTLCYLAKNDLKLKKKGENSPRE